MFPFLIMMGISVLLPKQKSTASKLTEDERGKALMLKIAAKDRKAFEAFYYLYAERIGGYLNKMLKRHDWVDEAVNDVMLAVWQSAERFDPDRGKISTWLFGIAHNKGLKFLERAGRRKEMQLVDTADEFLDGEENEMNYFEPVQAPSNPEKQVMGWQLGEALTWALSMLSEDHRCVMELSFKNGCSYQEIAAVMGCPESTVKTRMFHARKHLAEYLKCKGFNPADFAWGHKKSYAKSN